MIFITKKKSRKTNHRSNEKGGTIPTLSGQILLGRSKEFVIPSFNVINIHEIYEIICNTCINVR
jgi:hypothetical protein